jgi:Cof subfamily protein (haloacid dehalogenase superfamily)
MQHTEKFMNIKMIVTDIDDTLLTGSHNISERTRQALLDAQNKGIYVVLASGRPVPAMTGFAQELGLDRYGSYLISYNGAVLYDCRERKIIFEQRLQNEILKKLYAISERENVYIHTYSDSAIITDDICEHTEFESTLTGMPIEKVDDFNASVEGDVIKAMLLDDPKRIREVHDSLTDWARDTISMTISKPFFLEFMHKDVDKGATLGRLAAKLGIARDEIVAFGDSNNDMTMLQFAGTGVAMGNAKDEVKQIADCITACNNSDGIAEYLKRCGI